jgi:hypothetical protein
MTLFRSFSRKSIAKAAEHRRTPKRTREKSAHRNGHVLESGGLLPLWTTVAAGARAYALKDSMQIRDLELLR